MQVLGEMGLPIMIGIWDPILLKKLRMDARVLQVVTITRTLKKIH